MKKSIAISLILLISILFSCKSNSKTSEPENNRITESVPVVDSTISNRFTNIHFASQYDTSCGMPLAAGIEDTLHYKDKIYGFCSKQCKDEFISKLKKEKRR